jgi:hypothetical protein
MANSEPDLKTDSELELSPEDVQIEIEADPLRAGPVFYGSEVKTVTLQTLELFGSKYFYLFWDMNKTKFLRQIFIHCEKESDYDNVGDLMTNLSDINPREPKVWMWELARQYHYWANGRTLWPLPKLPDEWFLDSEFIFHCRYLAATRIADRHDCAAARISGRPDQPEYGRYAKYVSEYVFLQARGSDVVRPSITPREEYLLNRNCQVTPEWEVFLILVGEMTWLSVSFIPRIRMFLEKAKEHGNIPAIENFTTDATEETKDDENSACGICYAEFVGPTGEPVGEPAVKTACGHLVGKGCLHVWVKTGSRSCPFCRRELYNAMAYFPSPFGEDLFIANSALKCHLHNVVDDVLSAGPQQFCQEKFYLLLNEMFRRIHLATSRWRALLESIEYIMPKYEAGSHTVRWTHIEDRWLHVKTPMPRWSSHADAWRMPGEGEDPLGELPSLAGQHPRL